MVFNVLTPRAVLQAINSLAKGVPTSAKSEQVVSLLESLAPAERGEALRLLDGSAENRQAQQFLKDVMTDSALREKARQLIGEAEPFRHSAGRIIVSDIDDTVRASKDKSTRGPVYPGARAFYLALDVGVDGLDPTGDVHFVTARDGILVSASSTLRGTGIDFNSVSYGKTVATCMSRLDGFKGVEDEKVADVKRLLERNPSRQAVLLGDTLQADPAVYRRILKEQPDRVELVLIHRVNGRPCPLDMQNHPKVVVFDTYADAARILHGRGILNDQQLDDVMNNH